jgi:lysophospholipase L1-like esterase
LLSASGWSPTAVCWGGKETDWALQQIAQISKRGLLPEHVVIGFGTNDLYFSHSTAAKFGSRVAQVLSAIKVSSTTTGRPAHVWWVNQWVDKPLAKFNVTRPSDRDRSDMQTYEQLNAAMAAECERSGICSVIDWHALVASDPSLSHRYVDQENDGIHLTDAGTARRAELIVRTVNKGVL